MLSGHLCRCTGYAPIVAAIEDARDVGAAGAGDEPRAVAARRLRAAPRARGVPRDPLRRAAAAGRADRRRARRRARRARRGRPRQPARDGAPLLGRASGRAPCSCRSRGGSRRRSSPTASTTPGAALVIRDGDPLPDGPAHDGRARPRRPRDLAPPLHLGHDRAAEGRAALATRPTGPAGSARRSSTATGHGDRTLGVMPLYHTMGIHSLLAMHLVGGCLRPAGPLGSRARRSRLIEQRADHVALPRPHAVPRPASAPSGSPSTTSRASARSATRARR